MKKLLVSVLLLGISTVFGQVGKDPEAKKILDKTYAKVSSYTSFKVNFTYTLKGPVEEMNEVRKGNVSVKGDKYRISFTTGDLVINNTSKVWNYIKEDNEVTIYNAEEADEFMSIKSMSAMYKSGYKYRLVETQQLNGKSVYVIDLEPDLKPEERGANQVFKIRVFIDKTTYQPVRWRVFERSGNRYTFDINTFKTNLTIPESDFKFDSSKYPGIEVVNLDE